MLLVSPIFGGLVYPDLGNLSDQEMNELVYSLLADSNPGSNNNDMSIRAYDYGGNMYRRSPMQLDHSNPTTRLFTANPYHKRSASLFSGLNSKLKMQDFSNGLYKRSFFPFMKQLKMSLRSADDEKRSAPIFSGLNSRFSLQDISDGLYKRSGDDEIEPIDKRSAALFSGLNSKLNNGRFISGLYKRSASMFSGMNSRLNNAKFIDGIYRKRGDNYA